MIGFRIVRSSSPTTDSTHPSSIAPSDPPGYSTLLLDFNQVWSHYRHVENERNQFTGYFFTALLASIGFFVAFLSSTQRPNFGWSVVGTVLFTHVFSVISFVIYSSVKKFGEVISAYAMMMHDVWPRLYLNADPKIAEMADSLNVHRRLRPIMYSRLYSAQWNSEVIIAGTIALLAILQLLAPLLFWSDSHFSSLQRAILLVICCLTILEALLLRINHHIFGKKELLSSARRVGDH